MVTYLNSQVHSCIMEKEAQPEAPAVTLENVGKGLAFLGMVVFFLNAIFYLMSRAQPEQFNLFAGENHLIYMSIIALIFVVSGYFLTKIKPKPEA